MKGIIYKIVSDGILPYYGSTTNNLTQRKWGHISGFKKYNNGETRFCFSYLHLQNKDHKYILVEEVEVENRKELLKIEAEYIRNNECVNIGIPYLTEEEKQDRIISHRHRRREINKVYQKEYKKTSDIYKKNQDILNLKVICPYCIKTISKRTFKYKHYKKCLINIKWKNLCINLLNLN